MNIKERNPSAELLSAAPSPPWEAPKRDAMLAQAYLRASQIKEQPMSMIQRLFTGRPLAAQLAIALLLTCGLITTVLLLDSPGYAATNGQVLVYDLSHLGDTDAVFEQLKQVKTEFAARLPEGVDLKVVQNKEKRMERTIEGPDAQPVDKEEVIITAVLMLSSEDEALRDELAAAAAAAVPSLPAPTIGGATWFSENRGILDDGITIRLQFDEAGHTFTFPKEAGEAEIERTINAWLEQNRPDFQHTVDVSIQDDGTQRQIEVRVESKTGDGEAPHMDAPRISR